MSPTPLPMPSPLPTPLPRPIIVCADDFGIEAGVDAAIVELARKGRLSATGCLVSAQRFPEAATQLSSLSIDIGLHLNLTEYLGLPGFHAPLGRLVALSYSRRLSRTAVRQQINTQLDLFELHIKRAPDYVDGHLHVHQFPVIRDELLGALTQRYAACMPWLRDTQPTHLSSVLPFMQRFKAHVISALGSAPFGRLAKQSGAKMNEGLMGVYDFSRPHPAYLTMLEAWLKNARAHSLLMTHPAQYASDKLAFGKDRIEEYRVLGSEDFAMLLEKNHLVVSRLAS